MIDVRLGAVLVVVAVLGRLALPAALPVPAPRFERVLALAPDEGVFAYARISPDGRFLAYASETKRSVFGGVQRTIRVVDLQTREIVFTEPGIDAYWSNDGRRMIFLSHEGRRGVSIRRHDTGDVTRDVAPTNLGDYYSWGVRDGRDLILTILSRYYYLDGDQAVLPAARVEPCEGIGTGERPLLSKDGRRITTFVRGTVVIRNLTDCEDVLDTAVRGAKADFSFDGRYVALHVQKPDARGYEIQVIDVERRTVRTVTDLPGSSFFPSWTRDGRLSFRYDGDDYRGFLMAHDVLTAPERPLPSSDRRVPEQRRWADVFPETPPPSNALALVTIWGAWSAHSPDALVDLQRAREHFAGHGLDVRVLTATDPGSRRADLDRLRARHHIDLPEIPLAPERLALTEAHNQIPATLLFEHGVLVDRRLGAQTFDALRAWVGGRTP
jgi:hypothetical protein